MQVRLREAAKPVLRALAAAITLGSGASLGPEGPSVDIGRSAARALGSLLRSKHRRLLPLIAAGSGAGMLTTLPSALLVSLQRGCHGRAALWKLIPRQRAVERPHCSVSYQLTVATLSEHNQPDSQASLGDILVISLIAAD